MPNPVRPAIASATTGLRLARSRPGSAAARPGPGAARPLSAASRTPPPAPRPASPLRVLVAGADKDTRSFVEKSVRDAVASSPPDGPCTVSLVKLGENWSVTVDGPGERRRTLSIDDETLLAFAVRDAIRLPLTGDTSEAGPATKVKPEDAPPLEVRDHFTCPSCRQGLHVVYESHPDEPKEQAPVACPHCWKVGFVRIGAWAAVGRDYRCEKA